MKLVLLFWGFLFITEHDEFLYHYVEIYFILFKMTEYSSNQYYWKSRWFAAFCYYKFCLSSLVLVQLGKYFCTVNS